MNHSYEKSVKDKALKLRIKGFTYRAISDSVHVPMGTIYNWCRLEMLPNPTRKAKRGKS